jgi:transposase
MTRSRRNFTPQEKAAIVLQHLVDKTPVSDLCDEFGLHPTQFYTWQKQLTDCFGSPASGIYRLIANEV